MFEHLAAAKPDLILSIMQSFREDKRANKIDLSVGVYKNEKGGTPMIAAVREAEARLYKSQDTKTYLSTVGDAGFNAAITNLVFGPGADLSRLRAAQTPGGSGALRMIADIVRAANPDAVIHTPDPTWANHVPLLGSAGIKIETYPYYDKQTRGLNTEAMLSALAKVPSGDLVLLHGCCHNPSGVDPQRADWQEIAKICSERGLTPYIDLAYQGLGDSLDDDAMGLRIMAEACPELLVASSYSKNFGL